jgi:hypothetical protein
MSSSRGGPRNAVALSPLVPIIPDSLDVRTESGENLVQPGKQTSSTKDGDGGNSDNGLPIVVEILGAVMKQKSKMSKIAALLPLVTNHQLQILTWQTWT